MICMQEMTQIACRRWADVGPTSALNSDRRRHYNVGSTSFWPAGQHRQRWPNVGPTLAQCRPNVGAMLGQPSANVGATLGRRLGDVGPTFFCQHFANVLGDFFPPFFRPFTNFWLLIFPYNVHHVRHIFDSSKMCRKCQISRHVLVHALKHDIPMTSLRHQGNMSVTSQILTLLVVFSCSHTCTHGHGSFLGFYE